MIGFLDTTIMGMRTLKRFRANAFQTCVDKMPIAADVIGHERLRQDGIMQRPIRGDKNCFLMKQMSNDLPIRHP